MPKVLMTTLALVFLCAACSSTRQLDIDDDASIIEFNQNHADRGGEIVLVDGNSHEAEWILVDAQRTTWLPKQRGGEPRQADNDQVAKILYRNHGRGALEGFPIGLLAGVAASAVLVGSASTEGSGGDHAEAIAVYGAALGAVGVLLGTPTGAASGHRENYVLRRSGSEVETDDQDDQGDHRFRQSNR